MGKDKDLLLNIARPPGGCLFGALNGASAGFPRPCRISAAFSKVFSGSSGGRHTRYVPEAASGRCDVTRRRPRVLGVSLAPFLRCGALFLGFFAENCFKTCD